jgi:glycosyltransferase involved in cell wall biosynthesis
VLPYYQLADVFVLPSKNEGMSNALLEGLATGLPSIVTPVSGSVDLVEDGVNGYFTSGTAEDIANKVDQLFNGNDLSLSVMSTQARMRIAEKFDRQIVFAKHVDLFKKSIIDRSNVS